MSRAIMISSGGDPLLGAFCIDLIKKHCYDVVDSIYVCFNNYAETPREAEAEFLARYIDDPKIKIIYWPTQLGYGLPINKMLGAATEDLVCLIEDDGFLFNGEKVDEMFKKIESGEYDALGSPRFSCGTEISEALRVKYDLDYSGLGDKGPNFWPNFFFCKRVDLLKTDLNFAPKEFNKGQYYEELNHTMETAESADTFCWTSMQLRHLGLKIGEIPQFHASPYEITDKEKGEGSWIAEPYWIHGGSLSTGAGRYLNGVVPDVSNDSAKQEIETRVAFWMIVSLTVDGFKDFKQTYGEGIMRLVENCNLDKSRIDKKVQIYRNLMKV